MKTKGEGIVSLDGWTLKDSSQSGTHRHTYNFPTNTAFLPREQIYLHTGIGKDTFVRGTPPRWDLYGGRRAFIWNSDGDTATLEDGKGNVVDSLQVVPLKAD